MHNLIDWHILEFKKDKGTEKVSCPVCNADKNRGKGDKPIQVNHTDGYGKCFRCESLTFKNTETEKTEKEYKLPKQDWKNYTTLSDKLVKWLEDTRKIPQSTAIDLGWTEEKYYQPSINKEVTNIVFNYFEKDNLVNKKYRSGGKKFTQSAGTKSIFYNINSVIGLDKAYIVEGEFDVGALHSIGIKNVISVPNGANDNDDYWKNSETYLKSIKRFIIATDKDDKGIDLRNKIAQRLGRWRCDFIEWNGKDANDDLISGDLKNTVRNIQKFPVSGTFTITDLLPEVLDLYDNGLPKTFAPSHNCFGNLKNVYSTLRGQVNVGTGIPSHGKSNFTDWYVLNLIKDYDLKASWFSPEHSPMSLYQTNLIEKVIGKSFWGKSEGQQVPRVSKDEIQEYKEWADQKIYLTDAVDGEFPTWKWLFEKFKEQMYSYGIDIFVIDAFNKVLLPSGNHLTEISKVLTKLTHFAQSNNVIIFLIAHPTKMKKNDNGLYGVPTLYDVSGSADFRNMTHNGYTIYRNFENLETGQEGSTDFINMKTKFSFQGKMQESVKFKYYAPNGRYYANGIEPRYNMINDKESNVIPVKTATEAFDMDDDLEVPF